MTSIRKVVAAGVLGGVMVLTSACGAGGGGASAAKAELGAGVATGSPSAPPASASASVPAPAPTSAAPTSAAPSTPAPTFREESAPTDNVEDGDTYGVGMIVSVAFEKAVKNKDAVLKGITFETDNGTVVKGHWFGDQRVDFRPEKYWTPGTKVTVKYRLKGVEIAPGVSGGLDRDEPFTIGRSQVSTVDAKTHKMTIARAGETSVLDITSGSPEHPTWNGTMVISSKEGVVRMRSASMPGMTGEPYDLMVPHSMRLTDSGTYVHGNYWSNAFGKENVSHGCVGLKDVKGGGDSTVAGTFYAGSLIGDVVSVQNSSRGQVAPDNGLSGWNLAWSAW